MELESAITGRRSIRKFTEEDVPAELIAELIAIAVEAPSPGNQQGYHFYVINGSEERQHMAGLVESELDKLIAAAGVSPEPLHGPRRFCTWFREAPVVIAVSTRPYRSRIDETLSAAGYTEEEIDILRSRPDLQAAGAVIQNLLLAAYSRGYGTCWLSGPMLARPLLEEYLGIKPPESLAAMVVLGRPKYYPPRPERKSMEELITLVKPLILDQA